MNNIFLPEAKIAVVVCIELVKKSLDSSALVHRLRPQSEIHFHKLIKLNGTTS